MKFVSEVCMCHLSMSFESGVYICRLYLSSHSVGSAGEEEKRILL